jgi:hypothetical protein
LHPSISVKTTSISVSKTFPVKHNILFVFASFLLFIFSCKKSDTSSTNNPSQLSQLYSELRYTPQNLSVTAGTYQAVQGANGTVLNFYPNSFKDANNNIINSGTVNIQLIEMYKPGDMISNRISTTANGQLLQSGGQIFISATMNGQELFANKYGIAFKQSVASSNQMELYYGNSANSDSVVTWALSDTSKNGTICPKTIIDTILGHAIYYPFDSCRSFHWVNCDHFYSTTSPRTDVSVILPNNTYEFYNTDVFIILPDINSAVLYSTYNSTTNTFGFLEAGILGLPIGLNYELAIVSNKNGSYYYFTQSGVITNGMKINATMTSDTKNNILSKLATL